MKGLKDRLSLYIDELLLEDLTNDEAIALTTVTVKCTNVFPMECFWNKKNFPNFQ